MILVVITDIIIFLKGLKRRVNLTLTESESNFIEVTHEKQLEDKTTLELKIQNINCNNCLHM